MIPRPLDGFVQRAAGIGYSPYLLVAVPVLVGSVRHGMEAMLGHPVRALEHAVNSVLFYLVLLMLMTAVVSFAAKRSHRETLGAVSLGLVVAWLPPLLEMVLFSQPGRSYRFAREFYWHLAVPHQPIWETIGVWLGIALAAGFVVLVTRSIARALIGLVGAYAVMQFIGWVMPTAAERLALWPELRGVGIVSVYDFISILVALCVYLVWNRRSLAPSLKRVGHAIPCGLFAALGARMAGQPPGLVVLKGLAIVAAAQLVVVANDYYDRTQDASGGIARPVTRDDLVVATFFQVLLTVWSGLFDPPAAFLVGLFFVLALAYHHPVLRLKRLFCAAYTVEGVAAASCFLFGVGSRSMGEPWVRTMAALAFGGFALGAMIKDYKDVAEDRANRIGTIYTRQLARGRTLRSIHWAVSLAVSASLLIPPVWLAVRGAPQWHWLWLALGAPATALVLVLTRSPRAAVERGFIVLAAYLVVLVAVAPRLG
jgi:hypothetical protein